MRTHLDIKHTGNLGAEGRTAMTFDENSIAHLMTVLTDLYSDKELAVIREYSTNALDAHRAAGNPAPIEVQLPNVMSPVFVVRDHGTGMTVTQITDNFSKYGWSSKRDTDTEVGMLGLGCKSGLSYTSQFTMVSIHDGVRTVVLVTREEHGGGVVQIIDTSATDEPNGTEVTIPISSPMMFSVKAREFFSYWDSGTIMLDGEMLVTMWDEVPNDGILIDPDVILFPFASGYSNRSEHRVIMGGVSYPVNWDEFTLDLGRRNPHNRASQGFRVVARVPIGTVNFTPSREALQYTKRTKETLADLSSFVRRMLWDQIISGINMATTHQEAWRVYCEWKPTIDVMRPHVSNAQRQQLAYRGSSFPDDGFTPSRPNAIDAKGVEQWRKPSSMCFNFASSYDTESTRAQHLSYANLARAGLIVTGFTGDFVPAGLKERIRLYAAAKGIDGSHAYLYHTRLGGAWMDHVHHVDLETVRAIKLPHDGSKTKRAEPKYRVLVDNYLKRYQEELDEYPESGFVAWTTVSDLSLLRSEWLVQVADDQLIAVLTKRTEATFKRRHPEIPEVREWLQTVIDKTFESITAMDAYVFSEKPYTNSNRSRWYWKQIPDLIRKASEKYSTKSGTQKVLSFADPDAAELCRLYTQSEKLSPTSTIRVIKTIAAVEPSLTIPPMPSDQPVHDLLAKMDERYAWLIYDDCASDVHEVNCRIEAVNALYIVRNSLHVVPIL